MTLKTWFCAAFPHPSPPLPFVLFLIRLQVHTLRQGSQHLCLGAPLRLSQSLTDEPHSSPLTAAHSTVACLGFVSLRLSKCYLTSACKAGCLCPAAHLCQRYYLVSMSHSRCLSHGYFSAGNGNLYNIWISGWIMTIPCMTMLAAVTTWAIGLLMKKEHLQDRRYFPEMERVCPGHTSYKRRVMRVPGGNLLSL